MTVLAHEIAAFESMRAELESTHTGRWVVFHDGAFVGAFDDFEAAALSAEERFDAGPCLIRQVGAPEEIRLTGGMVFTPSHAVDSRRL